MRLVWQGKLEGIMGLASLTAMESLAQRQYRIVLEDNKGQEFRTRPFSIHVETENVDAFGNKKWDGVGSKDAVIMVLENYVYLKNMGRL